MAWQALLDWWFGPITTAAEVAAARSSLWFGKQDAQDADARTRFAESVEQALAGELKHWREQPDGWLAEVLLLDQLPRMIFRDTPRAFSGDGRALEVVVEGMNRGLDTQLEPIQRVFIYLVLEHAEDLARQRQAVECFTRLRDCVPASERQLFNDYLDFANRHLQVIARFGRFPHRNAILGRPSSQAEALFLTQPGSHF
ncbi:DUF924 family protein [Pseudomonas borbori]